MYRYVKLLSKYMLQYMLLSCIMVIVCILYWISCIYYMIIVFQVKLSEIFISSIDFWGDSTLFNENIYQKMLFSSFDHLNSKYQ